MITAAEAKTLYDQSGVEVDKYLQQKIEPEVKVAASSGNRTVFHFIGARDIFTHPRPDPLQTRIIEKLRALASKRNPACTYPWVGHCPAMAQVRAVSSGRTWACWLHKARST